jgi:hypothetical protein
LFSIGKTLFWIAVHNCEHGWMISCIKLVAKEEAPFTSITARQNILYEEFPHDHLVDPHE